MSNSVAASIQENLRDALVDYHLGQIARNDAQLAARGVALKTTDDLYDYLLLDTLQSSKVITTRLSLLTQSIQQYINRISLNLEPGLKMTSEETENWKAFADRYGYWRANQQLALDPDIYIDPTLRTSKTEFFFQLESALNQGKLTEESAENAVLGYLNRFESVSNLETIAGYQDSTDFDTGKMWFVARTRTEPCEYYWRSLDASQRQGNTLNPTAWSEWHKIEVPLQGAVNNFIRPVMMDNRLYICWLEVTDTRTDGEAKSRPWQTKLKTAWLSFDGTWTAGTTLREEYLEHEMKELIAVVDNTMSEPLLSVAAFARQKGIEGNNSYDWDAVFTYVCDGTLTGYSGLPASENADYSDMDYYGANLVWFYYRESENGGIDGYPELVLYPANVNTRWPIINSENMKLEGEWGQLSDYALAPNYLADSLDMELTASSTYKYDFRLSQNVIFGIWKQDANGGNRCWLAYKLLTASDYDPQITTTLADTGETTVYIASGFSVPRDNGTDPGTKLITPVKRGTLLRARLLIKNQSQVQYLQYPQEEEGWYSDKRIRLNTLFAKELINRASVSIERVLAWDTQNIQEPSLDGAGTVPVDLNGANGLYFWELFFHMPFLVAWRFNVEQRYEEATTWIKLVFNPFEDTDDEVLSEGKPRYWNSRPLVDQTSTSYSLTQPSDPDAIAASYPQYYQKAVFRFLVRNYLDHGDREYRQQVPSSRTIAQLHYSTASALLGRRPDIDLTSTWAPLTLEDAAHDENSPLKALEFSSAELPLAPVGYDSTITASDSPLFLRPFNEEMQQLWDRLENRLYNLRHNLTLDGKEIDMSLYDSTISPRDLQNRRYQSVVAARNKRNGYLQVPVYRFSPLLERAKSATETLIGFGASLLRLTEAKDSAGLTALQMSQSDSIYRFVYELQQREVSVGISALNSLYISRSAAEERMTHYQALYEENISTEEQRVISYQSEAAEKVLTAQSLRTMAAVADTVPNIYGLAMGGIHYGAPASALAESVMVKHYSSTAKAESISVSENFRRRRQEWEQQYRQASWDLSSTDQQIVIQQQQNQIAARRLDQIATEWQHVQELLTFYTERFTNENLYTWLLSQVSGFYLSAYDSVRSLCLSAESALTYELGIEEQGFVDNDAWNDVYQGLMAGESLRNALLKMERYYIDNNARGQEITRHISLKQLLAGNWESTLDQLKKNAAVTFTLPIATFKKDYPGLYNQRIKTVSVSVPMLVGPYENVCAQLTLTGSTYSTRADLDTDKAMLRRDFTGEALALVRSLQSEQAISLSHGIQDSGMFTLNFNDERFLPFEGAGVDSTWSLQFTNTDADLDSLTDVILHISYTARGGTESYAREVRKLLAENR